jgi:hypothetical protein
MKTSILFVGFLWIIGSPLKAQYQFQVMENDFIQIGARVNEGVSISLPKPLPKQKMAQLFA